MPILHSAQTTAPAPPHPTISPTAPPAPTRLPASGLSSNPIPSQQPEGGVRSCFSPPVSSARSRLPGLRVGAPAAASSGPGLRPCLGPWDAAPFLPSGTSWTPNGPNPSPSRPPFSSPPLRFPTVPSAPPPPHASSNCGHFRPFPVTLRGSARGHRAGKSGRG